MANSMSLESLAKLVLKFIAFILILLVVYLILRATKPSLFNIFSDKTTDGNKLAEVNKDVPVYSELIKNYKECKLSPSVECFCPITNVGTGDDYVIEFEPSGSNTYIKLYGNAQLDNCGDGNTISPTNGAKEIDASVAPTKISDDMLYFRNTIFEPSVGGGESSQVPAEYEGKFGTPSSPAKTTITGGRLDINDFALMSKSLSLDDNKLCSSTDLGLFKSNSIDLAKGAYIYRFDREKTAIISSVEGLKKCDYVKESLPADEEFNKIFTAIKECSSSSVSCSYPINIPNDFSIKLEQVEKTRTLSSTTGANGFTITSQVRSMSLYYKDTKVNYREFWKEEEEGKSLCQYTHFSQDKNTETPLLSLTLNKYNQIEIYPLQDKICILPYDETLTSERELRGLAAASYLNKPLVPE